MSAPGGSPILVGSSFQSKPAQGGSVPGSGALVALERQRPGRKPRRLSKLEEEIARLRQQVVQLQAALEVATIRAEVAGESIHRNRELRQNVAPPGCCHARLLGLAPGKRPGRCHCANHLALPVRSHGARAGANYLLERQEDDGTWHVARRAFPFQPTMDSGFPHHRDSWLSAAATSWAVLALTKVLPVGPAGNQPAVAQPTPRVQVPKNVQKIDFARQIKPFLDRRVVILRQPKTFGSDPSTHSHDDPNSTPDSVRARIIGVNGISPSKRGGWTPFEAPSADPGGGRPCPKRTPPPSCSDTWTS